MYFIFIYFLLIVITTAIVVVTNTILFTLFYHLYSCKININNLIHLQ